MKAKKIIFLSLVSIILIIFLIGLFNYKKISKIEDNEFEFNKIKLNKEDLTPEAKAIINITRMPESEIYKEFQDIVKLESLETSIKKAELEAEIINAISPYIKNIKIDNTKSEKEYAEEFKNVISKFKFIQIDFNDKYSISKAGEFILEIGNDLSKISVPKNYYEFHLSEVMLFSSLGYSLKKLSQTEDSEISSLLTIIINNLINTQDKVLEKL